MSGRRSGNTRRVVGHMPSYRGGERIRQYRIGMLDTDRKYMINLMNRINSDRDNPLLALAFSDRDELMNYLASGSVDALLLDERLEPDVYPDVRRYRCVFLTDDRVRADSRAAAKSEAELRSGCRSEDGKEQGRCKDTGYIFRYSGISSIVKELLRFVDAGQVRSRRVYRSHAVISPIGRCGKTKLAVSLCMGDEVRGGLYIGMEEYGSYRDGEDAVSNMLYLAKGRSDNFLTYIGEHVVELESYSVLGYLKNYTDVLELSADDMFWISEKLESWGRYTTVVWDIGQAVLKDLRALEAFDTIWVPTLPDQISEDKLAAFESMLRRREMDKTVDRMKKVRVPDCAPGAPEIYRLLADG